MRTVRRLLALLLLAAACGESSKDRSLWDAGADADAPYEREDGGGEDADGGADGSSGEHDSGPAQGIVDPASLWPLTVGSRWTYALQASPSSDTSHCDGDLETVIVGTTEFMGREVFEANTACQAGPTYYSLTSQGVEGSASGAFVAVILAPVTEGATFDAGGIAFVWSAAPEVTVPAGTFRNCWKRTQAESATPRITTYCPGVGMVRSDRGDHALLLSSYDLAP